MIEKKITGKGEKLLGMGLLGGAVGGCSHNSVWSLMCLPRRSGMIHCMHLFFEQRLQIWGQEQISFSTSLPCQPFPINQGSPTPGPWTGTWTGTGPWPVRNRDTQQEVSSGRASKASSVFTAAPHCLHYCLSSASCQHYGELYNYLIIYYNVIIIEIKCTINVMCLNHPKAIPPPWSVEKLSSTKLVPGAKKVGDRCLKNH